VYHSFVLLPCSGRDVRSRGILLWQLLNLLSSASKTDGRVSFLLVQFEFPIQFHGPSALRTHRGDLFCSTAHTASSADRVLVFYGSTTSPRVNGTAPFTRSL
jgi:hypothetical protein